MPGIRGQGLSRRARLLLASLCLAAVAGLLWARYGRRDGSGPCPVTLNEVRPFLPATALLIPDTSSDGWTALDSGAAPIGTVVRTSPLCDSITGYVGPTDTLVVFDTKLRVVGMAIRSSEETPRYVDDIMSNGEFLKLLNGKSWDEIARTRVTPETVDAVSGATMTCMSIAEGIAYRLSHRTHAQGR
jgi:NosR/NirI family transcriptional regulator, nitrous oxide reductase regulator